MSDELLPYYQQELAFLRSMGAEFADKHPKIAGRLHLNADGSHDPHVERIVQAFAYLNARIRHKLEDDFPEIVASLLDVLYPHYQAPTPSTSILQFQLDPSHSTLAKGYHLPRGTMLDSEPVDGERCRYQTCYPVTIWPVQVQSASLQRRPWRAPLTPKSAQASGVIRIELATFNSVLNFNQLQAGPLRFYLHAGHSRNAEDLYELLFNHTVEIAVADSPQDPEPVLLPLSALQPVGFERDEAVLPDSARTFSGYRLLTEYFAFPEKYLFFELRGLTAEKLARFGPHLELYFFLNRTVPDLERTVSKDNFRLGCTPVVNLFPQTADPFPLTYRETEYRVIPDSRRVSALEIYSIDAVDATSPRNEEITFAPFYSLRHEGAAAAQRTYWHAARRPSLQAQTGLPDDRGTEMYLSLVDLDFTPSAPANWTVLAQTTCLNRDLPRQLPFGGGRPRFEVVAGMGPLAPIQCLLKPTSTRRPVLGPGKRWRLLSHLSLNHLSLSQGKEGAEAFREILKLYDVVGDQDTHKLIESILRLETRQAVGRVPPPGTGLCQGLEVTFQLNHEAFSGHGLYLFGCVLSRFLGLYASVNSFTRLVATSDQQNQGLQWRWPARAGELTLL